jgi:hypothetical protein
MNITGARRRESRASVGHKEMNAERNQLKHKVMVGLYFLAGALWIMVAVRDIFAPGFFSFHGRAIGRYQIVFELAVAVVFLAIGVLSIRRRHVDLSETNKDRP